MTIRGHFKNGVVVFDTPPALPDGADVEVKLVEGKPQTASANGDRPAWGEVLKDFVGKAKGLPPDMAKNHDHYIHGARKR